MTEAKGAMMSSDSRPGAATEPAKEVPVAGPPPGVTSRGMVSAQGDNASPRPAVPKAVPVAKPAPRRPRIKPDPAEEVEEELLPPSSIKGWAISLAVHALLMIILALWVFTPQVERKAVIDTTLAGSELGDESAEQFTGELGMDTPLLMPLAPLSPALQSPALSSLTAPQVQLEPSVASLSGNDNSNGVNLSNPGNAGEGDGFGVARFGQGGETINGVDVKVGDPQFTLIWDTRADIDIHVLEPGGSHIYWESRNGNEGGELDVDDVDGYGPENVYWVQGQGPPGDYKWYVHYYGGLGGIAAPTRWKVRLKHDGKVTIYQGRLNFIGAKSRTYSFNVEAPSPAP